MHSLKVCDTRTSDEHRHFYETTWGCIVQCAMDWHILRVQHLPSCSRITWICCTCAHTCSTGFWAVHGEYIPVLIQDLTSNVSQMVLEQVQVR